MILWITCGINIGVDSSNYKITNLPKGKTNTRQQGLFAQIFHTNVSTRKCFFFSEFLFSSQGQISGIGTRSRLTSLLAKADTMAAKKAIANKHDGKSRKRYKQKKFIQIKVKQGIKREK
jgi:hypothetical protein